MPRLLIVVSDAFDVGIVVVLPRVPFSVIDAKDGERLRPGADLELRRPDGTTSRTKLYGFDSKPCEGGRLMALSNPLTKAEVPAGTEIWMVD
jgi:hypothetical protein